MGLQLPTCGVPGSLRLSYRRMRCDTKSLSSPRAAASPGTAQLTCTPISVTT